MARRIRGVAIGLTALLVLGAVGVGLYSQSPPRPLLGELRDVSVPFRSGEELRFEVNWKPVFLLPAFKAGELTLRIERSEYGEKPTYTITATAVSDGLLSSIAGLEVRDYFESTVDRGDFRSYRVLKQTRQGRRKRDLEVIFDYQNNRMRVREVDLAQAPPKVIRNEVIPNLNGPVADVVSVFYVTRLEPMAPPDEFLLHLSDEGKTRAIPVKVERLERLRTDLGRFNTVRLYAGEGVFGGGGNFRIWYSRDELRIPVRFEANVRFGKVYGQIIQMDTGSYSRGLIRVN